VHAYSGNEEALNEFRASVDTIVQKARTNYLSELKSLTLSQRLKRFIMNVPYKKISPWHQKQDMKKRAIRSNPFL
jgi:hypothetical protein